MRKVALYTMYTIVVLAVLFGVIVYSSYNRLVALDERVQSSWSQVENQLQRRADLIPNLVETVKGYASHERAVFERVSQARAALAGARTVADRAAAEGELSSALGRLLAIAENYPQLKADANFRQLSDELAGTENRIAVARMDYNESVRIYNSTVRRFPTVIVASLMGFDAKEYFQMAEGSETVPKVQFGAGD